MTKRTSRSAGAPALIALALAVLGLAPARAAPAPPGGIQVVLAGAGGDPVDGRLLVVFSTDPSAEPRMQITGLPNSQIVFGQRVEGWRPGTEVRLRADADGWPVARPAALKPGVYRVQAVLNRYETFHLADGRTLKLPPDQGEGQHWNLKPGNPYSAVATVTVGAGGAVRARLRLDRTIPPIVPPRDTPFVRHVRIRSALLSAFWGRDVYLGAHVLLPAGFAEHPSARYPLMVFHGHFPEDISEFRTTPPDPDLKPVYSERFHLAGYNRIEQEEAYKAFQRRTSADFPRFLVVEIEHANPYYDDSYAVNSANLGPYGDAINHELIPAIEAQFRGIGAGWARFTYGGSTGGWEAMATQIFYPEMYNGAFVACPDPIDFHAYTNVDLYADPNMFVLEGAHIGVERPSERNYLGQVLATQRGTNQYEVALGDRSRSGEQYDVWQAVFSPAGVDGYPKPIFDKRTGAIDRSVADYWREHFDLTHILERDWPTLGPKVRGKLHIYVGSADTYYLNDAVYFAEATIRGLKNPPADAEFAYGERAEHCWNGDPSLPNAYSRLHYNMQYLPKILDQIARTAPPGADLTSWRY